MFDATQIAADGGRVLLDGSGQANIDMGGGDNPALSLIQKNLWALKADRQFGFKVLRSAAVASLSGVAYTVGSPA